MNIQDRLNKFISTLDMSVLQFERKCNISAGTASRLSEKSYANTFNRISRAFPQLNMDWLKSGNGEMLNPTPSIHISIDRRNSDGDDPVLSEVINLGNPELVEKIEKKICSLELENAHLRETINNKDALIKSHQATIESQQTTINSLQTLNQTLSERLAELKKM